MNDAPNACQQFIHYLFLYCDKGIFNMIFYRNDYITEETLRSLPSPEQNILREFAGLKLSKAEAQTLWSKILDHKWYVSERLRRDIGLRVAAVDYIENYYVPASGIRQRGRRAPQHALSPTVFVA